MCKCVKLVPSVMFAMLAGTFGLIGCSRTVTVSVVEDAGSPVASVPAQTATDTIPSHAPVADESSATAPVASDEAVADSRASSTASDNSTVSDEPKPSAESTDDKADATEPTSSPRAKAPAERIKGLGQFGGGGGMMGGGGGGGMGGGMGGMGGGGMGGMGGGGGVSIDPKIQLKKDSSGKLDQRRKEATGTKPNKGDFSSN